MKRLLLLFAIVALSLPATAQQQKGKLTVKQDPTIGEIVNKKIEPAPQAEKKTPTPPKKTASGQEKPATKPDKQAAPEQEKPKPDADAPKKDTTAPSARENTTAPAKNTYRERQRYNAQGFRIQIFTGGNSRQDKVKAQQAQQKCRQKFPELSSYVHFYTPHWVCRVGDFQKRADAQRYVNKLRSSGIASEVRIVKSNIFVAH